MLNPTLYWFSFAFLVKYYWYSSCAYLSSLPISELCTNLLSIFEFGSVNPAFYLDLGNKRPEIKVCKRKMFPLGMLEARHLISSSTWLVHSEVTKEASSLACWGFAVKCWCFSVCRKDILLPTFHMVLLDSCVHA